MSPLFRRTLLAYNFANVDKTIAPAAKATKTGSRTTIKGLGARPMAAATANRPAGAAKYAAAVANVAATLPAPAMSSATSAKSSWNGAVGFRRLKMKEMTRFRMNRKNNASNHPPAKPGAFGM